MNVVINRKQYMENTSSAYVKFSNQDEIRSATQNAHHEYYSQFATEAVQRLVAQRIGRKRILESADPSFNDIPLANWDRLHPGIVSLVGRALSDSNASCESTPRTDNRIYLSLSDTVCTAKAAARIIKEKSRAGN